MTLQALLLSVKPWPMPSPLGGDVFPGDVSSLAWGLLVTALYVLAVAWVGVFVLAVFKVRP